MPQTVGDGGVFFDPLSVSEFAAAFADISDERRLKELAPNATRGAAAFTWERMAQPVVDWVCGRG